MNAATDDLLRDSTPAGVDYRLYHDPEVYRDEQRHIFQGRTWCYLGLEAEVAQPGDFKATFVGDTPVVLTRDRDGSLQGWVNRCAHKGAQVCREVRGHSADGTFVCVYHQWAYNARGELVGVPFQKGLKGVGGFGADFDRAAHGLQRLRVGSLSGMVFGTLSGEGEPLEEYLGEEMVSNIRRMFARPVKVLGYARQYMRGNWKLYSENSRDSYHGGLLHLFYPTFGIYRQSQQSETRCSEQGYHTALYVSRPEGQEDYGHYGKEAQREMKGAATLQDPRVIAYRPDHADRVMITIQSLFPSVVLQQIQNTLATRQVLPKSPQETELVWTYFGFADEDEETTRHRLRNINLVGPAGYISMEDGEAVELCQRATAPVNAGRSFVEMGGRTVERHVPLLGMDENAVRGFWKGYLNLMRSAAA